MIHLVDSSKKLKLKQRRIIVARLNQIIAIEKGVKATSSQRMTQAYHAIQKPQLWFGIARNYTPKDDEGDRLPSESTQVQLTGEQVLEEVASSMARLFDVTATKDATNAQAKADVIVDGQVLLSQVPVVYLLFLEKQLTDIHTFVKSLPVLDPAEHWQPDPTTGWWSTDPAESVRTKKIPKNHVKAEATQHHPAQVEIFTEDVIQGTWKTTKYSGALPPTRVQELTDRVETLQQAVKFAREEGNTTEVQDLRVGEQIFSYLFS